VLYVDSSGNTYIGGATSSSNFPVTSGVVLTTNLQPTNLGFLSKIDPTGQTLLFSTYIAGLNSVVALAFDSSGNIFVAGSAVNTGLPIPPGIVPSATHLF
jgi:Beta-propeller repeat